jgi:hypothetical protein
MITDRDPGDEDDRDDERIVSAVMRRSMPAATSKRLLLPLPRARPVTWFDGPIATRRRKS